MRRRLARILLRPQPTDNPGTLLPRLDLEVDADFELLVQVLANPAIGFSAGERSSWVRAFFAAACKTDSWERAPSVERIVANVANLPSFERAWRDVVTAAGEGRGLEGLLEGHAGLSWQADPEAVALAILLPLVAEHSPADAETPLAELLKNVQLFEPVAGEEAAVRPPRPIWWALRPWLAYREGLIGNFVDATPVAWSLDSPVVEDRVYPPGGPFQNLAAEGWKREMGTLAWVLEGFLGIWILEIRDTVEPAFDFHQRRVARTIAFQRASSQSPTGAALSEALDRAWERAPSPGQLISQAVSQALSQARGLSQEMRERLEKTIGAQEQKEVFDKVHNHEKIKLGDYLKMLLDGLAAARLIVEAVGQNGRILFTRDELELFFLPLGNPEVATGGIEDPAERFRAIADLRELLASGWSPLPWLEMIFADRRREDEAETPKWTQIDLSPDAIGAAYLGRVSPLLETIASRRVTVIWKSRQAPSPDPAPE